MLVSHGLVRAGASGTQASGVGGHTVGNEEVPESKGSGSWGPATAAVLACKIKASRQALKDNDTAGKCRHAVSRPSTAGQHRGTGGHH